MAIDLANHREVFIKSRGRPQKGKRDDGFRINRDVIAPEVRLIGESGEMLGVMSSREAYDMAQNNGLDLIEIAPNAKPPTCKLMDYGKWKYENKKKQVVAKKKQVIVSVKEIQIRPRTEEHDMGVKLKKAKEFLDDGHKVKVNLRFQGREMAHQEIGVQVLEKFAKNLSECAILESAPKKEGRQMFILLAPEGLKKKN